MKPSYLLSEIDSYAFNTRKMKAQSGSHESIASTEAILGPLHTPDPFLYALGQVLAPGMWSKYAITLLYRIAGYARFIHALGHGSIVPPDISTVRCSCDRREAHPYPRVSRGLHRAVNHLLGDAFCGASPDARHIRQCVN
jgi:hypothetical protein